jgi:hypothetical protein
VIGECAESIDQVADRGAPLATAGLFFLMRLSETATVVDTDLQLSAGNRRQSRSEGVLRGCEGPRSDAKVASDPGAPSHFFWDRSAMGLT